MWSALAMTLGHMRVCVDCGRVVDGFCFAISFSRDKRARVHVIFYSFYFLFLRTRARAYTPAHLSYSDDATYDELWILSNAFAFIVPNGRPRPTAMPFHHSDHEEKCNEWCDRIQSILFHSCMHRRNMKAKFARRNVYIRVQWQSCVRDVCCMLHRKNGIKRYAQYETLFALRWIAILSTNNNFNTKTPKSNEFNSEPSAGCQAAVASTTAYRLDISIARWRYCSDSVDVSHSRHIYCILFSRKQIRMSIEANLAYARFSRYLFFIACTEHLIRVHGGYGICSRQRRRLHAYMHGYCRYTNRTEIEEPTKVKNKLNAERSHVCMGLSHYPLFGAYYVNYHQNHIYSVEMYQLMQIVLNATKVR